MEEPFDEIKAEKDENLYEAKQDYKAETQEELRNKFLNPRKPKTHNISFMQLHGKDGLKGMENGDIVWVRQASGSVERYIVTVKKFLDRF